MTSEQKVKVRYPNAEARTSVGQGWGVFFHGRPLSLGPNNGFSGPDAYGNTKSNAWVNAAIMLGNEGALKEPMSATKPEIDTAEELGVCYLSSIPHTQREICTNWVSLYPAVDVERELYLALVMILPFLNKLNPYDYAKTARIAHDAIKLYEEKVKPCSKL